ncbi:ribokinase [Agathobaculum sp. TL06]
MQKRPRILVVGSFMMDLVASTKRAPREGETVIGMKFTTAPGGKGSNQAVQCARLGAEVTMVGKVGRDGFGKTLLETASAAGVDVSRVLTDPAEATGVAHITLEVSENDAKNRITVCPGANFTLTVEEIAWLKARVADYDLVMLQLELPMEVVESVAAWAYEAGVPVMLNPAPAAALSDTLLGHVTYLSPNEHEAALMSGQQIAVDDGINQEDLHRAAGYFMQRGVKNLIVTLGANGSVWINQSGAAYTPCVHMDKIIDTTAAGDSFVAAFCTARTAGMDERQALVFASHAAAITVSRMGAMPSLPTIAEVKALLAEKGCCGIDMDILNMLERSGTPMK